MLSPYDMLQEPTGDSSSPKLVPSSFPTATQAEWQRDPTSVAGYFARIKEVEVAACVEMQRLKEQGSVERCRITEEHRSRRYDRWADTAKATASEDASTHREAIAANREVAQHAISTSAWVEESQARSRSSLLPGPVAWPWSALAANVVLWGGMRRLGLRSWRGAVVWLVLWALALRKARGTAPSGGAPSQRRERYPCLYPPHVFLFLGLLGGPRRHRWIRLEILVRTHPGRGLGSSGIGAFLVSPLRAQKCSEPRISRAGGGQE
ncbi:unnamed protein product [Prorocentrum cordatum]|uniref:Uncharacterized protein n=1 Tax=Prorocentrum cordatum TaxID=2364126 RepID=A0ABN9XML4_9DINO|nr:unnamed protein product [Polarella glacialis]